MTVDVRQVGANASLTYVGHTARVRCSQVTSDWSVNSEESHARQHKAFYPHRRSQGGFSIKIDCKGWREFRDLTNWFRGYASLLLDLNRSQVPPPMSVSCPSREFLRLGIPTTGMEAGDHLGAIVYSPVVQFISVSDPTDPSTGILRASQVSRTSEVAGDVSTLYFYPDSRANSPGGLQALLYDQKQADARALEADLQAQRDASRLNPMDANPYLNPSGSSVGYDF
jgi:hypothetical protein